MEDLEVKIGKDKSKRSYFDKPPISERLSDWFISLLDPGFSIPICLGILGIGGGVGIITANGYREDSRGEMRGTISRFAKEGHIFKNYEGKINGSEFSLNGDAEDLAKKISQYFESQNEVKLTYIKYLEDLPWRGKTPYLVQSVEPLEK